MGNFIIGKEFQLGEKEKGRTLSVNIKSTFAGGVRTTPIDINASKEAGYTIRSWDQPYSQTLKDIYRTDLSFVYMKNNKHTTHEFELELLNFSNNQRGVGNWYDAETNSVMEYYQLPLVPNLMYKLHF